MPIEIPAFRSFLPYDFCHQLKLSYFWLEKSLAFHRKKNGKTNTTNPESPVISGFFGFVIIILPGHSAASILLANGYNLKEIGEWLGHSDPATTNMYAHLQCKAKLDMANTVNEKLYVASF